VHVITLWILEILDKMLGQDSLHKGSSCEVATLVDLVAGNVDGQVGIGWKD